MSLRRGVSLMEVLVSIGVVSIGLMGVATLIPLAFHQAEMGARNDRKALAGKRAYREFSVLDMGNPLRWIDPVDISDFTPGEIRDFDVVLNPTPGVLGPRRAFCIDPRWVAADRFSPNDVTLPVPGKWWSTYPAMPKNMNSAELSRYRFPGNFSRDDIKQFKRERQPLMHRITLGPAPGFAANMTAPQADEIFVVQDDLEFEIPKQQTLSPIQTAVTDFSAAKNPLKRYAQGNFSWFGTLVPESGFSDLYKLSIVVCYQRDMAALQSNRLVDYPRSGIGFAGGDIELESVIPAQVGEYVLLSRNRLIPQPLAFEPHFQWYRVVAVDGTSLTLHGVDWDFTPVVPQGASPSIVNAQRTYVTYVPGITSVFEKTIRLETSSMWTTF